MNCSFNIRYKPRTTRQFTKSDLTVYDSAGNTALNALTVYGKSEVVDDKIISAGEGYATVDLGTLDWSYLEVSGLTPRFRTYALSNLIKVPINNDRIVNAICPKYQAYSGTNLKPAQSSITQGFAVESDGALYIKDTDYTDATAFKNSLNGVILAYQLADPTQGNTIAVKTDDGSGINGTMAVFETGTPLRGIPDSDVRDVMAWDGSSGEVTKNCGEVDLGTLNWNTYSQYPNRFAARINTGKYLNNQIIPAFCANYTFANRDWTQLQNHEFNYGQQIVATNVACICICDTDYNDVAAFTNAISGVKLVYELATPVTTPLTATENASIAALRTYTPQTHAQNNAQTDMTVDYTIRVPTI